MVPVMSMIECKIKHSIRISLVFYVMLTWFYSVIYVIKITFPVINNLGQSLITIYLVGKYDNMIML